MPGRDSVVMNVPSNIVNPWLTKHATAKWFTACGRAVLEITGYAFAIWLAEVLFKIWSHQ